MNWLQGTEFRTEADDEGQRLSRKAGGLLAGSFQGKALSSLLLLTNGPTGVFPEASRRVLAIIAVGLLVLDTVAYSASCLILLQGSCHSRPYTCLNAKSQ